MIKMCKNGHITGYRKCATCGADTYPILHETKLKKTQSWDEYMKEHGREEYEAQGLIDLGEK